MCRGGCWSLCWRVLTCTPTPTPTPTPTGESETLLCVWPRVKTKAQGRGMPGCRSPAKESPRPDSGAMRAGVDCPGRAAPLRCT
jgi:hypothetical protein